LDSYCSRSLDSVLNLRDGLLEGRDPRLRFGLDLLILRFARPFQLDQLLVDHRLSCEHVSDRGQIGAGRRRFRLRLQRLQRSRRRVDLRLRAVFVSVLAFSSCCARAGHDRSFIDDPFVGVDNLALDREIS
jgi:hypothetical protein